MPSERSQAIELLSSHIARNMHGSNEMATLLRNGHKGFAAYTDLELLRAIQALAKKTESWEVRNFVSTIAADKFMLE